MRWPSLCEQAEEKPEIIERGDISILSASRQVYVRGNLVVLTKKEYTLFELLCLNAGIVMTKDMALDHLYANYRHKREPEKKILDIFICKIRKKIAAASGGKDYIETVWGRGYRIP